MGAIAGLLLLPVMAPVWGFRFLVEELQVEAESVLHDENRALAELIDLSRRRAAGKLSDDEYAEQESELLERLNSIREYQRALDAESPDDEGWWLDDDGTEEDW